LKVGESGAAEGFGDASFALAFADVLLVDGFAHYGVWSGFGGELGGLRDIGGAREFASGDLTGVGVDFAGENLKEGGFAGPVGADEADAIAFADGERDVGEQPRCAERFCEGLCVEDRRQVRILSAVSIFSLQVFAEGDGATFGAVHRGYYSS